MTIASSAAQSVTKSVASSVTKGQGASTPAGLDILASVGTSTSLTTTGTKAVTGIGFTPKLLLPSTIWHTTSAALSAGKMGYGAAVSMSSRFAIGLASVANQATSITHRRHTASKTLSEMYNDYTDMEADLSAFGSDGFTLSWTPASGGVAFLINHVCLGGADLEVSLTQCQMNGTNAAQSFAHGLSGGAPTGVLFFSTLNSTSPVNTATTLSSSIGAWASSGVFGASAYANNGVTTTSTRRVLSTAHVLANTTTSIQRSMTVSSVDATNVNVTYPDTTGSTQHYFWMLAIRGAKCQVGTFDPFGGSTITTTGITPKLFLPVILPTGTTQSGTVNSNLMFSIGASDGTNNVSCGISDADAVTTTNARRFQSASSLALYDEGGTKQFEATAAFSGESVVLTRTTNNQYFGEMGYLVIGS